MEYEVMQCEPLRVAYLRHVGPYMNVGTSWTQLMSWAMQNGLFTQNTQSVGVGYDDPFEVPAEELRYDACITIDASVTEAVVADGPFEIQELNGGKFGVAVHKGHYAGLPDFYPALKKHLVEQGEQIAEAACREIYLNSPMDVEPEDLLTEVYIPIV